MEIGRKMEALENFTKALEEGTVMLVTPQVAQEDDDGDLF